MESSVKIEFPHISTYIAGLNTMFNNLKNKAAFIFFSGNEKGAYSGLRKAFLESSIGSRVRENLSSVVPR
ncbi:hypothetical protein NC652_027051 [Populus alba x Populus x berolinensis]|nr:hypothetical protein NC652_027047 [Populus alba x Populus x berolinensis]KAJ6901146.1 hypothetical protein NC652_027051 [Populus alba x Populus x berolinensis]